MGGVTSRPPWLAEALSLDVPVPGEWIQILNGRFDFGLPGLPDRRFPVLRLGLHDLGLAENRGRRRRVGSPPPTATSPSPRTGLGKDNLVIIVFFTGRYQMPRIHRLSPLPDPVQQNLALLHAPFTPLQDMLQGFCAFRSCGASVASQLPRVIQLLS